MSVDRQIVLMLIQRARTGRRLPRRAIRERYADQALQASSGAENEAHNAAEVAHAQAARGQYGVPVLRRSLVRHGRRREAVHTPTVGCLREWQVAGPAKTHQQATEVVGPFCRQRGHQEAKTMSEVDKTGAQPEPIRTRTEQ
jgi:hypothetical protein